MATLKNKIDKYSKPTPEEAAKMDASIRENRRSVGARRMVDAVRAAQARGLKPAEIEALPEMTQWKADYPRLFAMVNDPAHSPAMLYAMLAQLEAVEQGQRSTHDASVVVGTMLVNSYVRPQLGMAPAPLPDSEKQSPRQ